MSSCRKRLLLSACFGLALAATAGAQLPPSNGAPKIGEKAPDFTLPDKEAKPVRLYHLLGGLSSTGGAQKQASSARQPAWLLLVFYRGYW